MASARTKVRRHPERGAYDRATIDAILDEALMCHVGFVQEGQPFVIPTIHARLDDILYVHGSTGSRLIQVAASGAPLCVTVTLLEPGVYYIVSAAATETHDLAWRDVEMHIPQYLTIAIEHVKALNREHRPYTLCPDRPQLRGGRAAPCRLSPRTEYCPRAVP